MPVWFVPIAQWSYYRDSAENYPVAGDGVNRHTNSCAESNTLQHDSHKRRCGLLQEQQLHKVATKYIIHSHRGRQK